MCVKFIQFLPSTVKRETASAWECIGSSRCSNMSAFVAECTVNAGETSQQGKRECTSSTLCLSSAAGHRMPLSAANSTRG